MKTCSTIKEFSDTLTGVGLHSFVRLTSHTLFFRDEVDTVYVHIAQPRRYVYNVETDRFDTNNDPHFKITVFSEGDHVLSTTNTLEVRDPSDWENALQEVLHRF
jgi:hypothetical protein